MDDEVTFTRWTLETLPRGGPFPSELTPICDRGDPWMSAWNNAALAKAMDEKLGPLKDCEYEPGSRRCRRCGEENYLLRNVEIGFRQEKAHQTLGLLLWQALNGLPQRLPDWLEPEDMHYVAAEMIRGVRPGRVVRSSARPFTPSSRTCRATE